MLLPRSAIHKTACTVCVWVGYPGSDHMYSSSLGASGEVMYSALHYMSLLLSYFCPSWVAQPSTCRLLQYAGQGGGAPTHVTTVGSRRVDGTVCLNYIIVHTVLLCSVREWYIHPCLDSLSSARCFKAPGKESKSGPMDSAAWRLHWVSNVLVNAVISSTQFVSGSFNFQLL